MKNSQCVTAYLDYCEMRRRQWDEDKDSLERIRASNDRLPAELEHQQQLYEACLAAGWTTKELEEAYARRFGLSIDAIRRVCAAL